MHLQIERDGVLNDLVDVAPRETMGRRRATGGPAELTFSTLVGMQLRPRSFREAHTVFAALRSRGGLTERDALWAHPDLLPNAEDLEDPLGFLDNDGDDVDISDIDITDLDK